MTGYMNGKDEYIEVQAPGVEGQLFNEGTQYIGKILSCYVMNYILHIVVAQVRTREAANVITLGEMVENIVNLPSVVDQPLHRFETIPPDEEKEVEDADFSEEDEDEAVSAVTADGTVVTKKNGSRMVP